MNHLDLSGLKCPFPVLETKKFLAKLTSGTIVEIITTDPDSIKDLQDFCTKTQHVLLHQNTLKSKIITQIKCR